MKYTILFDPCLHDLINLVNDHIEKGWKCQGGICVDTKLFLQAMVKELHDSKYQQNSFKWFS